MKYLPLIWAGLWRKPLRTIFTFFSIVVAFVLFGLVAGVDQGMDMMRAAAHLDRLDVTTRFGAPLPVAYKSEIERLPNVTAVAGITGMGGYFQNMKNLFGAQAIRSEYFTVHPELTATKQQIEALANTRTGAITTVALAEKYGWKVGDKIPINSVTVSQTNGSLVWTFDLLAVIDDADRAGIAQYFFINYDYFDEARAANKGTIGRYSVHIRDPAQAAATGAAIDGLFANSTAPTRTNSEKANVESQLQTIGDINFLLDAVGGAVLFMLLFITGNSMMQSVRERIPEFGVLKTLGFTDLAVLAIVLAESVVEFLVAAVLGLIVAQRFVVLTHHLNGPPLRPVLPWAAVAAGIGFALVAAILSAIFPAWRVKRLSVIDALAGR